MRRPRVWPHRESLWGQTKSLCGHTSVSVCPHQDPLGPHRGSLWPQRVSEWPHRDSLCGKTECLCVWQHRVSLCVATQSVSVWPLRDFLRPRGESVWPYRESLWPHNEHLCDHTKSLCGPETRAALGRWGGGRAEAFLDGKEMLSERSSLAANTWLQTETLRVPTQRASDSLWSHTESRGATTQIVSVGPHSGASHRAGGQVVGGGPKCGG